jgi:hypothetical protein
VHNVIKEGQFETGVVHVHVHFKEGGGGGDVGRGEDCLFVRLGFDGVVGICLGAGLRGRELRVLKEAHVVKRELVLGVEVKVTEEGVESVVIKEAARRTTDSKEFSVGITSKRFVDSKGERHCRSNWHNIAAECCVFSGLPESENSGREPTDMAWSTVDSRRGVDGAERSSNEDAMVRFGVTSTEDGDDDERLKSKDGSGPEVLNADTAAARAAGVMAI